MKSHYKTIIFTSVISILLLIVFFYLQQKESSILKLDEKWLMVAAFPVIIGLVLSGVISRFKGFGIELETNLTEKVEIEMIGEIDSTDMPKTEKLDDNHLNNLSHEVVLKTERLQFVAGNTNYREDPIKNYFNKLKNLRFIEITNEKGGFLALIPISVFKRPDNTNDYLQIQKLREAIENRTYLNVFSSSITELIKSNETLIEAYKVFDKSYQGKNLQSEDQILPVVDNKKQMIGIVSRIQLTEKIVKQVLKASK